MPIRFTAKGDEPDTLVHLAEALRAIARDHKTAAPVLKALADSYDQRAQAQTKH